MAFVPFGVTQTAPLLCLPVASNLSNSDFTAFYREAAERRDSACKKEDTNTRASGQSFPSARSSAGRVEDWKPSMKRRAEQELRTSSVKNFFEFVSSPAAFFPANEVLVFPPCEDTPSAAVSSVAVRFVLSKVHQSTCSASGLLL